LNLANCYVTIVTTHDVSTLEISVFSGIKMLFLFLQAKKKYGKSTRILHLKEELVLFFFKYCDREKRRGRFVHCFGRVSCMAICYFQQERRESRTIALCLTRKKKRKSCQLLLVYFLIYF